MSLLQLQYKNFYAFKRINRVLNRRNTQIILFCKIFHRLYDVFRRCF